MGPADGGPGPGHCPAYLLHVHEPWPLSCCPCSVCPHQQCVSTSGPQSMGCGTGSNMTGLSPREMSGVATSVLPSSGASASPFHGSGKRTQVSLYPCPGTLVSWTAAQRIPMVVSPSSPRPGAWDAAESTAAWQPEAGQVPSQTRVWVPTAPPLQALRRGWGLAELCLPACSETLSHFHLRSQRLLFGLRRPVPAFLQPCPVQPRAG